MFSFTGRIRFYLYAHPTDMRKSFDGLSGLIRNHLLSDPLSGDVYLFINRRSDRIKLFVWGRDGWWIYYKRLEKGTFQIPLAPASSDSLELAYEDLLMLLEGIDLKKSKKRVRFGRNTLA
jgi:transposase